MGGEGILCIAYRWVKSGALHFCAMGRANQRPRKRKGHQAVHHDHLAKVDSAEETRLERSAVMDVMGLGNASPVTRTIVSVVGALLLIGAVVALVVLTLL